MPWTVEEPGRGFTTAEAPWFPFAPAGPEVNVTAQAADPGSLFAHYRELIRLRHSSRALGKGELELLAPSDPAVLAFVRRTPAEAVLVVHNLGAREVVEDLAIPPQPSWGALLEPSGAALQPVGDALRATLPARSTSIWRLER